MYEGRNVPRRNRMIEKPDNLSGPRDESRRILYLDHTAKVGGGEIALLNLLRTIDTQRFTPLVVLASEGPLAERLSAAGIETLVLTLGSAVVDTRKDNLGLRSLLKLDQAWAVMRYSVKLSALARRRQIQIVHTNSLKSDIYGGLAGFIARVPVIWHVRDNIDDQYLPHAAAVIFRWLARHVPRVVIANSESTLRRLEAPVSKPSAVVYSGISTSGPASRRMHVVHDGTPMRESREAELRTAQESVQQGPVIVLVGRIAPWKGQHIFIEAAAAVLAQHPTASFWIVGAPLFGEDEYELSLHKLAADLKIKDQIQFLGFRNDVGEILEIADIVVHASTLGEPFGQVVIEGMAAGKPVIATDGGALPEIVQSGETGLLVPMGDAPRMAEAIASLLADPVRAEKMGEAGRQHVMKRFTIEQTARKVEAIYDTLLGR